MKLTFFTPGPSQLYPTYKRHVGEALRLSMASISHRSEAFHEMFRHTQDQLRALLGVPRAHQIFFVASATEVMERVIENLVEKKSYHLVNGAFSNLFFDIAGKLNKQAEKHEVEKGQGFTDVTVPRDAELVAVTQNETSTGVATPMEFIYELKRRYPQKLMAVDVVSSAPHIKIDYNLIDCVFFSVQKGFGLPAGLAVMIVSPQAIEKAAVLEKNNLAGGSYHRFSKLLASAEKLETPETPNVLNLYVLGKVAHDMHRSGIAKIRKEITYKAKCLYEFFGRSKKYSLFVQEPRFRSETVVVANVKGGSGKILARLLKKGLVVGNGYKEFKGQQIRIANFPAHSVRAVKTLMGEL